MSDLLQEVDEMMRQERLKKIWDDYGNWIIAFIVLTIVFTGAISTYKSWNNTVQEKQTKILIDALENPNFADIMQETAKDLRPNIRGIALLSAAAKHVSDGKIEQALPLYNLVKTENGISADMRDMASVLSVKATLETAEAPDTEALKAELKSVWSKKNSPWKYHAHLEAALLLTEYESNYTKARSHLQEITKA